MRWTSKNQSKSQKVKTLENIITQLVDIANGRIAFLDKNKVLFDKKVLKLKVLSSSNQISKIVKVTDTPQVIKLKKDIKLYKEQRKILQDLTAEIVKCQNQLQKLLNEKIIPAKSRAQKNVSRFKDEDIIEQSKIDMWRAKANAFDGDKRKGQAEVKSQLKKQLIDYPKCPYCEASLIFENCHVDHIYPANRGGLTTPDNMVLICSPCNLSKGSDSLRNFAKRNHLNYNNIVTRLEVMGKHI